MISVQEASTTLSETAQRELAEAEEVIDEAIREDGSLDKIVLAMNLSAKVEREIFKKYNAGGWVVSRWGNTSTDSGYTFTYPQTES